MQSQIRKLSSASSTSSSSTVNVDFDLGLSAFRRACQGKGIKFSSPTTSPHLVAVDAAEPEVDLQSGRVEKLKMNDTKREFKINEDAIFERMCERVGIRVSKPVEIVKAVEVVAKGKEVIRAGAGMEEVKVAEGEEWDIKVDEKVVEIAGREVNEIVGNEEISK